MMNVLSNNILTFHLHYLRGSNPATLTNDEAASQASNPHLLLTQSSPNPHLTLTCSSPASHLILT